MDFESALTYELKKIAAFSGRIYPHTSPEANKHNGVPYLIYVSSEGERTKTMGGYVSGRELNGELNIVAARYKDLKQLTREVLDVMIGTEERSIGVKGPYIQEFTYEAPVELYEEKPDLYRCLIQFQVYFEG